MAVAEVADTLARGAVGDEDVVGLGGGLSDPALRVVVEAVLAAARERALLDEVSLE
jgi:hypothetical protein